MSDPTLTRRLVPTPAWLIFGLLVLEGLLWLSGYEWFGFNHHKGWTVLIAMAVVAGAMLVMLLWIIVAPVFRCRFQFSIRSLLVLVVAVAVPCSWLAIEMKKAKQHSVAFCRISSFNLLLAVSIRIVQTSPNCWRGSVRSTEHGAESTERED